MSAEMELPEGWQVVKLSDEKLFAFESGLWTGKKAPFVECAVVRNTNFRNDGHLDFSDVAMLQIEARQLERKRLKQGDIIIERSGGGPNQPVGRVVLFELSDGDFCFSNFTARLRVADEKVVDFRFLNYHLLNFHYSGQTELLQRRTTGIRNLDFTEYKNAEIFLPPLPEQRAIAGILGAVQAALAARRREQHLEQEHKAALLEQLFTRGTRGEATRETEIGELPVGWGVTTLKKVFEGGGRIQTGPFGSQLHSFDYLPVGIPVLNPTHLGANTINRKSVPRISPEKAQELSKHFLKEGDILISRRGDFSHYAYITPDFSGGLCGTGCFLLRVENSRIDNYYLSVWLGMRVAQDYLRTNAVGTIMPNLNTTIINGVPVIIPPLPEQERIAAVLGALDAKLGALVGEVARLEELFRALLEELLSGRLRVGVMG